MSIVDLRSDTVTKPTDDMRRAAFEAAVGDDQLGEDPSVNELEALAADITGKEAALFVSSGILGNQLAVLSQTQPGDEIIVERNAHIFVNERAALARLCLVQAQSIAGLRGILPIELLKQSIRPLDDHQPRTTLICIENTHNLHGGAVLPMDYLCQLWEFAHKAGIAIHMDGARVFNAAAALDVPVKDIAKNCDTLMFCLSKGLSAPVGSMLCGSREIIARARQFRLMLGGAMRQSGMMAAAGIIALRDMPHRLLEDHHTASKLAQGIAGIDGLIAHPQDTQTNIVFFHTSKEGAAAELAAALAENGLLVFDTGPETLRAVTHRHISPEDIDRAIRILSKTAAETGL